MPFQVANDQETAIAQVRDLIARFEQEHQTYSSPNYSEAQLRNDFINPFLQSFGWDVNNEAGKFQAYRDVLQEESIEVEENDALTKKKPDYTLRIEGVRKIFVEAKKAAINITNSRDAAFQTRRYGWNGNLGVSILFNFTDLIVYDCRERPNSEDGPQVARYRSFDLTDYIDRFDELYQLLAYTSVREGILDEIFAIAGFEGQRFDNYFLDQIEGWRFQLAEGVVESNDNIENDDINLLIQRLLNRIIFLRICEDKSLEQYERLREVTTYAGLRTLFQNADQKYDSGLFDFIEDQLSLEIELEDQILIEIFNQLYYPQSPYNFSVVEPAILSQIYERFLGKRLHLENGTLAIVDEPEVAASNGVVPTPKYIADYTAKETLSPLLANRNREEIADLKIADICCGSGIFLLSVLDVLIEHTIQILHAEAQSAPNLLQPKGLDGVRLTLPAKRELLLNNIFGVDINPYAVEVTRFSLLLKLLEDETPASIQHYQQTHENRILPSLDGNIKCGNSLVDNSFYTFSPDANGDMDLALRVNAFSFTNEFQFLAAHEGFDAIIGNPPYVRIQKMTQYAREERQFYQSNQYGYVVARKGTIDKYYVFLQKAISLLNPNGRLGYIVTHKFFLLKDGQALRRYITENAYLDKIIHFGVTRVFAERLTYTALLFLQKDQREHFQFRRVSQITPDIFAPEHSFDRFPIADYQREPWVFVSPETKAVFDKLTEVETLPLSDLAAISVGLQTSRDKVYIFEPTGETDESFQFAQGENQWEIEKAICKPCILDLTFHRFETIDPNAQMIYPYRVEDGRAVILEEEDLAEQFPLCHAYLTHHREDLERRSLQGDDPVWYEFGRSQSLVKFLDAPKLIWKVLSLEPSYVYDTSNILFTGGGNGPFYGMLNLSDYSLLYFIGILCHPVFEKLIHSRASVFQGEYYSHGKQFMVHLPIRIINFDDEEESRTYERVVETVQSLIDIKNTLKTAHGQQSVVLRRRIPDLEHSLKQIVSGLYNLTDEECETVQNDPAFSQNVTEE